MPRPSMPPTPSSSTEIKGQDTSNNLSHLQMAFELPPSAIVGGSNASVSPKTTYPVQPSEAVKARRRSSAAAQQQQQQKDAFALPPPPTRSRKIIQMKPQAQAESTTSTSAAAKAAKATTGTGTTSSKSASESGSKKKQTSATSAAGRKIARKTAHSLIERRRRSKMNEEFAVLKGLIPACTGDMHKLAILQASIEYVRYLEDCITSLKSQCDAQTSLPRLPNFRPSAPHDEDQFDEDEEGDETVDADAQEDVEMTGSSSTPVTTTHDRSPPIFVEHESGVQSHQPSVSPALLAQDVHPRQQSYSSVSTADRRHYSVSSSVTSPMFRGQAHDYAASIGSISHSALTSPALMPQQEDHEATAALLMLNADRRGTFSHNSNSTARGMSVRDLLSS